MKYLMEFLKQNQKRLWIILFAALLEVFGTLLVPFFVKEIIDTGIVQKDLSAIFRIGLQMLAAAAFTALLSLWGSYLCADLAALAGKDLRKKIFDKTQMLSIKDFNHFGTASMITRATGDITVIQQSVILFSQMILPTPLIAIAAIIMTALIYPSLIAIPLVAIVIFFIVIFFLFRKAKPISESIQKKVDSVNWVVRESIIGIRVIRAFDNSEYEQKRTDNAFSDYANHMIRLNRIFAAFNPLVWAIMGIAMVAVVWFGGYFVLHGQIQVGSIAAVSEYTILMLVFLMMSAMVLVMLPRALSCLKRIQEVLDTVPEILDAEDCKVTNTENPQKIVFDNVSFSYQGAEKPVLENLNFVCGQGKTTAIIGGTGSGKSTIAALMLRLYDVAGGQIRLEGEDIRNLTQHQLRQRISYVPQKAFLFSGTIADNLRMGSNDATKDELRHAAEIAQAAPFISTLDLEYGSPVAQGGTNFSGGQKQRLSIARALVKKAPVYLLDDCFSALDYKTDAALRSALRQGMKDAAVVIIAQRISTIMDADQIIVLDAGRIAGVGTHEELLKSCDVYKEIADSQLTEKERSRV
ncbi:ABC transporter ATP-binding protein [Clostridium minihomine]|uniref:ABC transporter ATP-binding protein n=1 Tax=Clostridium minihomine TaxID=2045012 RepID=UPI000C78AE52|nr:ABC transporter ATP-binding protein [Clostridium minihomine]